MRYNKKLMKNKFLICVLTLLTPLCWAVNSSTQNDQRNQVDKGLLDRMSSAEQKVSAQASTLIANAMQLLGVPYHRGGTNESSGFDCSGFVRAMYEKSIGIVLPHNAREQASVTDKIDPVELQPGDLVFFNTMKHTFSHVGIYLGNGKFIHSPRTGYKVRIEDMRDAYWSIRFNGARRVPIDEAENKKLAKSLKAEIPNNFPDSASTNR